MWTAFPDQGLPVNWALATVPKYAKVINTNYHDQNPLLNNRVYNYINTSNITMISAMGTSIQFRTFIDIVLSTELEAHDRH